MGLFMDEENCSYPQGLKGEVDQAYAERFREEVRNFQEKIRRLRQQDDENRAYLIKAYQRCIHIRLQLLEALE